uniref:NADH dehydrogenase subunit 6 n=1 Tax=Parascaris univalens TaxID=6257 RepID=A0A915AMA2_PARUN
MFLSFDTYEKVFQWIVRVAPIFFLPFCISAFLTAAPLTNIAFWVSYAGLLSCICVHAARKRNNRYLLIPFVLFKACLTTYAGCRLICL